MMYQESSHTHCYNCGKRLVHGTKAYYLGSLMGTHYWNCTCCGMSGSLRSGPADAQKICRYCGKDIPAGEAYIQGLGYVNCLVCDPLPVLSSAIDSVIRGHELEFGKDNNLAKRAKVELAELREQAQRPK